MNIGRGDIGNELGHQNTVSNEVESNALPVPLKHDHRDKLERTEFTTRRNSIYTCSSFITKYDGQKIWYFLYRRLKQNEQT